MNPNNTITSMIVYGNQSSYIQPPSDAQKAAGTVPLDTLPADWWNRMWMDITQNMNNAGESLESVYQELKHLLEAAGITPSSTSTSQVLAAVRRISRTIATSDTAGAVVSSSASGKVSVDQDGVMTPNGMGTPTQLNTSSKVIVTALNEVLTTLNNYMTTTNSALNGRAPIAHASSATTYGLGNASKYGHVKLSSAVDSTSGNSGGVAATPAAVKAAYDLAQCACDLAAGVSTSINVYCGSTCKCTINSSTALCLGSNAFNSTAFTTCVGTITSIKVYCNTTCKCEIKDAGGNLCLGSNAFNSTAFTTCVGTVTVANKAACNEDTPVALCTGEKAIGRSTSCALKFNTCTGALTAAQVDVTNAIASGWTRTPILMSAGASGASKVCNVVIRTCCTNASCALLCNNITFCGSTGRMHGDVCGNTYGTHYGALYGATAGTHYGALYGATVSAVDPGATASKVCNIAIKAYCTNANCAGVIRTWTFCGSTGRMHGDICGNLYGTASCATNATCTSRILRTGFTDSYNFDVALTNGATTAQDALLYASACCRLSFCSTTGHLCISNSERTAPAGQMTALALRFTCGLSNNVQTCCCAYITNYISNFSTTSCRYHGSLIYSELENSSIMPESYRWYALANIFANYINRGRCQVNACWTTQGAPTTRVPFVGMEYSKGPGSTSGCTACAFLLSLFVEVPEGITMCTALYKCHCPINVTGNWNYSRYNGNADNWPIIGQIMW